VIVGNTWTDSTTGGTYWGCPSGVWESPSCLSPYPVHTQHVEAEKPERKKNMDRCLFRITVVNPKTATVGDSLLVIAKDESEALLKADIPANVRANADDYDFCIEEVGSVRAKRETQKVKVVKDDE